MGELSRNIVTATYATVLAAGFALLNLKITNDSAKKARIITLYVDRLKSLECRIDEYWISQENNELGRVIVRDIESFNGSLWTHFKCISKCPKKEKLVKQLALDLYMKATGDGFESSDYQPSELTITVCRNLAKELATELLC